jgi:endonuclease I
MKKILLTLAILYGAVLMAQIPPGYYNSAAGLTGAPLKAALHNIIKNHTVVSYNSLPGYFQTTDKKSNGKVWDIYSDIPGGTPPYEFTFSTDQCGNYSGEGDCFNREHTWPQSWFNSVSGPYSDLFHIMPTDGYVNGRRSNYPFGDVGTAFWTSLNGSKLGACIDAGYSSTVFEPIDEYKGDVARNFFYMSTRYMTEDGSWSSSAATNKSNILQWEVNVLMQWNHEDTVSAKEIARNNAIYGIQDNRNPYIDHPEWVDSIWVSTGTGITEPGSSELSFGIYPDPVSSLLNISCSGTKGFNGELIICNALGENVKSDKNIEINNSVYSINCEGWKKGIYFIRVISKESITTMKFVKI